MRGRQRSRSRVSQVLGTKKPRLTGVFYCGRYWDRTSDLFRVREARYRCANRPSFWELHILKTSTKNRGGYGIRTRVNGFAGRCLASRPTHHLGSYQTNRNRPFGRFHFIRADDEIRTRDPHLGKVMRYHCATSATVRISAYLETLAELQDGNQTEPFPACCAGQCRRPSGEFCVVRHTRCVVDVRRPSSVG